MAAKQDAAIAVDRQAAQQADELADLRSVVLIAGESVGTGIDHQHLRPDRANRRMDAVKQRRRFDDAGTISRAQDGVLAGEGQQIQAAGNEIGEAGVVMRRNVGDAALNFVGIIFGAEIDRGPGLGQHTKPVAAQDMRGRQLQCQQRLPDRAFTGKQGRLPQRDPISHRPQAWRRRRRVPRRHVNKRQRFQDSGGGFGWRISRRFFRLNGGRRGHACDFDAWRP